MLTSSVNSLTDDRADRAVRFIEKLRHTKGQWAGIPFTLPDWQKSIIRDIFGTIKKDGSRQYRTAYIEIPRKNGKALAVDTPMLTTGGWSTIGKLKPGDFVFSPDGQPTEVVAVSDIWIDHDCYKVTFSDGRSVVADAEHEWVLFDRYAEKYLRLDTRTISKRYMVGNRNTHRERRYNVNVPGPIQLPKRELPIDPYVLGIWLGDGTMSRAEITGADDELFDAIRNAGYQSSYVYSNGHGKARTIGFLKFKCHLNSIGVIGNKHIPVDYLLSSVSQRKALLAGLLDTDGTVILGPSKNPRIEFTNTKRVLADAVLYLARSLGWKASIREGRAKIYGRDCGPKWRVCWTAYKDESPFSLKRKTERLADRPANPQRSRTLQVIGVERVPNVPTRCIRVENESGMYLAGSDFVPTHNSELGAAIALYLLFGDGEKGAEIYSAAADRDQASIVFHVAAQMIRQAPDLGKRCKIVDSTKRIVVPSNASYYRAISAEAATKHGYNASGIIFDELHAQPNRELWDVLTTSGGTRRQPLVVAITTAGYDRNSICWEQHEYAENVKKGIVTDPTFYPYIRSAPENADWTDEKVWKECNPALGDFRDVDEMRSLCEKAKQTPALQNTFRRLYLCQWTQQETRWMPIESWDATAGVVVAKDLEGETCYAGLDLASTNDVAAFVLVSPDTEGCYDILPFFFIPEDNIRERCQKDRVPYDIWINEGYIEATPGNIIDDRYIKNRIKELGKVYDIREIGYDRWGAAQIIPELTDEGFTVIPTGQGFGSMAAPTAELMKLVLAKRIRHGGNPVMRWMANNMVVRQDPAGNLKPDKGKSLEKIDGMVALIMALDRALRNIPSVYETHGIRTLGD